MKRNPLVVARSFHRLLQNLALSLVLCLSACSFFAPNEPETFGDLQLTLQLPERASDFVLNKAQALDRVLIVISEAEGNQNPRGREIARREFFLGNARSLRAALRVPLRKDSDNCLLAEVMIFDRLDLLYNGQGFPCFRIGERNVSTQINLETAAFFIAQPIEPLTTTATRLTPISIFLRDTTITHFEIITDSVRAVVTPGARSSNFVTAQAFVFGDTTDVKIRAWRNLDFKGEAQRRFVYTGPQASVLVAMTWNSLADFDLEIINPAQQIISPSAPGDSINGALILPDANGFGPELFEWRQNPRLSQGTFTINARRSLGNLIGSGNVYVYLREGQAPQRLTVVPFDFKPTDTPLFKAIHSFNWP